MRPKTLVLECPCQSHRTYNECCGPYLDGAQLAPNAQTLMRSRYSAYVLENGPYLLQTWHFSTRPSHLEFEPTKWLGLTVQSHDSIDDTHAQVMFRARYKVNGRAFTMQEQSQFIKENEQWFYVDGVIEE